MKELYSSLYIHKGVAMRVFQEGRQSYLGVSAVSVHRFEGGAREVTAHYGELMRALGGCTETVCERGVRGSGVDAVTVYAHRAVIWPPQASVVMKSEQNDGAFGVNAPLTTESKIATNVVRADVRSAYGVQLDISPREQSSVELFDLMGGHSAAPEVISESLAALLLPQPKA